MSWKNSITGVLLLLFFEPSIDYVIVKDPTLGTLINFKGSEQKTWDVYEIGGEVMGIASKFSKKPFQKACQSTWINEMD